MFNNQQTQEEEEYTGPREGSTGWYLDQQNRQEKERAAAAQQAAANQPAPQPADEVEAIIEKHKQAAQQELVERSKLTARQREFEGAKAREEEQRKKIILLSKNPTRNAGELEALTTQFNQTHVELERLHKEMTPPEPVLWDGSRYGGGSHEPFDTSAMAAELKKYNGHGGKVING